MVEVQVLIYSKSTFISMLGIKRSCKVKNTFCTMGSAIVQWWYQQAKYLHYMYHIEGLMKDCSDSNAFAMELLLSHRYCCFTLTHIVRAANTVGNWLFFFVVWYRLSIPTDLADLDKMTTPYAYLWIIQCHCEDWSIVGSSCDPLARQAYAALEIQDVI